MGYIIRVHARCTLRTPPPLFSFFSIRPFYKFSLVIPPRNLSPIENRYSKIVAGVCDRRPESFYTFLEARFLKGTSTGGEL